jgi:WD repeat-containing protein 24
LDINSTKTHAVLAGKEILKTVRFEDGSITEDVNLRFNINTVSEDIARKRRDFLPATDVKWSHGNFANFIATAANNEQRSSGHGSTSTRGKSINWPLIHI